MPLPQVTTSDYPEPDRARLGIAVTRAREAAGWLRRKDLAARANVSVRSLAKLESGEPGVGRLVLEAVGRTLPGWTADTPRLILDGEDAPPPPGGPTPTEPERPAADVTPEPMPQDFEDEHEYMNAVYWYLRQWMSHDAVMRGFHMAAAVYERKNTQRNAPKAPGNKVG